VGRIHDQLRSRRQRLGLRQSDMPLRAGIARQQYHRLENGGNPNLETLELAAAGLDMVLMLIPKERLGAVRTLLAQPPGEIPENGDVAGSLENPWDDLLGKVDDE
jgi:HTH-type transcriptional regulator / antitoxin HipB